MANSSALEIIPASATCKFVGEGRANLVFTLADVDNHPNLRGQLLRVPKQNYKALPYADIQQYWQYKVSPLFKPSELVQQRLVKLPSDPAFFRRLNHQLRKLDDSGTRRSDFVGHAVSEDVRVGMLVEDMRGGGGGDTHSQAANKTTSMHEIKPKWLIQSPRAPRGAEQCRNCAREVWRNMKNKTKNPIFCPLNLVKAADFPHDETVAKDIAADLRRCYKMTEHEAQNFTTWLRSCELFKRLRKIQWDNDHTPQITSDEAYSLAMTLRDCSLFVLVPSTPNAPPDQVIAKLGDTDMKNFAVKKDYWIKMEKEFHDSGVYWNTDKLSISITDCQLPFYRSRRNVISGTELGRYYPAV
ncbi:Inositol-pentakisphosphate 2-kinase [Gnomoniopsis smithogilvyi]|uniref:Inositol-pentakisphosphate 2-kinase n=1 Tax=Gnomoniopsis smithogilvyi TaxID=1191159 RepID=A0A9W8YVM7_9PEZI|nr:Inositol-pentakisphosphate 2-kinase [Gnomoniopsis smithogilvyi]